jgi:hypothetical protein
MKRKIKFINSKESLKELSKFIEYYDTVAEASRQLGVTRNLIYNWKNNSILISAKNAGLMQELSNGICKGDTLLIRQKQFIPARDYKNLYEYVFETHIKPKLELANMGEDYYFDCCINPDIKNTLLSVKTKKYSKALVKVLLCIYGGTAFYWESVIDYYIK